MKTLITNAHLVSPDVEITEAAILINGDTIETILSDQTNLPEADKIIDAGGNYVFPGFIDIHTHGAGGYDVTDCKPEGIEEIAKLKIKEGVTSFCPTTLTLAEETLSNALKVVADYQQTTPYAKVPGVHLEGPYINSQCAGAQNPDFIRLPDIEEIKRLNDVAKVAIISFAPELEGAPEFTKALTELAIIPSGGHSAAKHADIATAKASGLKHLTHFCNQMTPLHHRDIGMVGSGLLDDELTIEMICDKIHLCPEMIQLAFKCKDSNRIVLITDAMSASWLDNGDYDLGGLAVVVKDGAARLASNGALAGSTLKYNEALKNVYEVTGLPLSTLIKATSYNQARNLNLEKVGKLEKGFKADIAILEKDFTVVSVLVDGKEID